MEVTCRTIQGRFLLKPSEELRSVVLGVLGRAQRLFGVELHAFVFLSNHYHLLLSVSDADQLARFMNYLNSNLAREVGRLYGWQEKFWGRRYQSIVVSQEEAAQVARLRYVLSHGSKEGLVARPRDWPGAQCVQALVEGQGLRGLWWDRTRESAARLRGERVPRHRFASWETIELVPLPCWCALSEKVYRDRVRELVREIERETASRHAREGSRPLGVKVVVSQDPHARPERLKKGWAPAFHTASKAARRELVEAYRWFVGGYREAAQRLRQGRVSVGFPQGSFPPRLPFVASVPEAEPG